MNYFISNFPNPEDSFTNMTVQVNFDGITRHLLIQRVFNNYYIITGIIFLIIGIILCFFGTFDVLPIISVCMIFGQIISFFVFEIIIGINKKWFEFLYIAIGILIGGLSIFLSAKNHNIYKSILGITSGIIFGIYIAEIFIFSSSFILIYSVFLDTLLISIVSFLIIVRIIKKYYTFLYSLIGGYILVRGLSILLFKWLRYRELQIILYFIDRNEWEYIINNSKDDLWNSYYIYDILILVFIVISMIFYWIQRNFFKSKLLKSKKEEQNKTETEIENDLD
jgi:hypothetical protein